MIIIIILVIIIIIIIIIIILSCGVRASPLSGDTRCAGSWAFFF